MLVENIKTRCRMNGITLAELERETGISNGTIAKWEHGKGPRLDSVLKVAEYFHCSVDILINGPKQ